MMTGLRPTVSASQPAGYCAAARPTTPAANTSPTSTGAPPRAVMNSGRMGRKNPIPIMVSAFPPSSVQSVRVSSRGVGASDEGGVVSPRRRPRTSRASG